MTGPPMATYRLQFNRDFRLDDALPRVAYFSRLGITHLYASPLLRARTGSAHGYDVVNPAHINPELGDETVFRNLVSALHNFGLGLVLDIVPNHMAATIENPYWRDVLTYGAGSPFARWFDIDWRMPNPELWGRVLAPVLGQPISRVIDNDEIRLSWSDGRFLVHYYDHMFPIDPATVPDVCLWRVGELESRLEPGHPAPVRLRAALRRLKELPRTIERVRRHVSLSRDEIEGWLAELARLITESPAMQSWAETTAAEFSHGDAGRRRLRKLLDSQPYRLVYWRESARVINYRRFFDIDELIAVRQEDPQVFDETHATIVRLVREGLIDGLRVDHIDGLRDPRKYLEQLAQATALPARRDRAVPIFVEKILAADESLPEWPVAGTTGYEFLNQVEALFLSPLGLAAIESFYRNEFAGQAVAFRDVAAAGKRRVLQNELSPHVGRLADVLARIAGERRDPIDTALALEALVPATDRAGSDSSVRHALDKEDLARAIVETIVALPVYRTYVDIATGEMAADDRQRLEAAVTRASDQSVRPEAIEALRDALLLGDRGELSHQQLRERISFLERLQQLSGPAAAKGIEDTALYAYVPLVSLNEVGSEPDVALDDAAGRVHRENAARAVRFPRGMLCVTTHDTKRTADVRARLDVLSEIPDLWKKTVRRWRSRHRSLRRRVAGRLSPSDSAEYLLYQTILGLWPVTAPGEPASSEAIAELRPRLEEYLRKAIREAKIRTSWTAVNEDYERAVLDFLHAVLPEAADSPFVAEMQSLADRVARPGFWNSLARTVIQHTSPGTPDIYQGDELWNFALVDPDNRRPVDYDLRQRLLDDVATGVDGTDETRAGFLRRLVEFPEDGRIKLHAIRTALTARREHPTLFAAGDYTPLVAAGPFAGHVFAFARRAGDEAALVVVPRLTATLAADPAAAPLGDVVWRDTAVEIPEDLRRIRWTAPLTRESMPPAGRLRLADALRTFPVCLLIGGGGPPEAAQW